MLLSPPKTRNREPLKPVDDFDRCAIRNKIHEFYTVRRQLPTIAKLHESLKDDIKFDGSVSLLCNIVKELGFKWKRSQGRRKVIIERYDIVDLRCRYLKKIHEYREKNMNIVYIDETWIDTSYTAKYCWQSKDERGALLPISRGQRLIVVHGGGCTGFAPGDLLVWKATSSTGEYHSEMNGQNFQKWFCEKLLENISVKSVIVMDNASYHSCKSEKCPNSSTRKADIQAWLTKHNIPFDKKLLRPELLALAKANKPEPQYIIDDIAKEKEYYSATSAVSPRLEPHRTGVGTT